MTTSNRKKSFAASDNQALLLGEKEALLKLLLRQVAHSTPQKLLHHQDITENEVIFQSDVDGVIYYIVRCSQKNTVTSAPESVLVGELGNDEILLTDEENSSDKINLSPREQAIAKLVAQGFPNKLIALHLQISHWTVATHLRRIFVKLGVTSRTAMITRLLEDDLLM